jgi:protein-disulfide isomerase
MISWRSVLTLGVLLALPFPAQLCPAQQSPTDELKKEISALNQSVKSMQKDLQEIKALLQSRSATSPPANAILDLGNKPSKGERSAKLTLVEFSDYQCPYCGKYARETAPEIVKQYVESGKLRYVVLNLPLESIHPLAFKAAEAADCAREQGKYWEMRDRLFANQKSLEPWTAHAEAVGLDVANFQTCLNSGKYTDEVRQDMAEARKAGVTGTPAFFLAYTGTSSKIKTLTSLKGAQSFSAFKAEIDKLLDSETKAGRPTTSETAR